MKNGQTVTLTGEIVDIHVTQIGGQYFKYPFKNNFYSGGGYYAIYSKEEITYRGKIEIQGIVTEITLDRGNGEVIHQFDILVDSWKKI